MPSTIALLARGTVGVLAVAAAVSGAVGVAAEDPLVALNSFGFIGACAFSATAVFFAVASNRLGFTSARTAATALLAVLTASATVASVGLLALSTRSRFTAEAASFGLHSICGVVTGVVFAVALVVAWHDRKAA